VDSEVDPSEEEEHQEAGNGILATSPQTIWNPVQVLYGKGNR